ncbi:hypothetical protein K8P10_001959 [Leucobacter sp. Psy1]|uniref:hypothetical protein n=1 Tax=Leucobacter sp. Psy1 TaxID=2875729 RepID=UPI001CD5F505|nr:hypothetical protein [Leucobacter sp. Psy1]UBH06448.1 hypothetical protein K8P10_001959 [Leucobacter sp. Psy1]
MTAEGPLLSYRILQVAIPHAEFSRLREIAAESNKAPAEVVEGMVSLGLSRPEWSEVSEETDIAELRRQLESARSIAVSLEQELALAREVIAASKLIAAMIGNLASRGKP